ncbi:MAG TPA: serine/threonine-protein kinase [Drouetiella sp.]
MSTPDDINRGNPNDAAGARFNQTAAESNLQPYDFQKDSIIAGKYRIISVLGRGGMGVVYRVEQAFVGKHLALKTIKKSEISPSTLKRFEAEAKATFSVSHPSIIAVKDYGLIDNQIPFMAMELLEGETLSDFLKHRTLSVPEAVDIFVQVCFGLAHAHDNGVIHRDIKPSNLMLTNKFSWDTEGSVKIMDFGIAKLTQHDGGEIQALTRTGEIFGSPYYMSPEQCSGEKIDNRTDVYSLGCVLFESLTGRAPFAGDTALNTMMMHQNDPVPTLKEASGGKEFPEAIESVVKKMLSKHPGNRYPNLGETAHDLAAIKREDYDSVSAYRRDKSKESDAKTNRVVIKKTSYAYLLFAVAVVSGLTTAIVMWDVWQRQPVLPQKPVKKLSLQTLENEVKDLPQLEEQRKPHNLFAKGISQGAVRFLNRDDADDNALADFKGYKDVQDLDVSETLVTDKGFANLLGSKLLKLNLQECEKVTSVDNISQLSYLQDLNLSGTNITEDDLPKLARMTMLHKLNLVQCKLNPTKLFALTKSHSLNEIVLPNNPSLPAEILDEFAQKMPSCTFTFYSDGPSGSQIVSKQKGLSRVETMKREYEILRKADPKNDMCSDYIESIAILTYQNAAFDKKSKPAQQELLTQLRKGISIVDENQSYAKEGEQLLAVAESERKCNETTQAIEDAKKAVKLCTDTAMHCDQKMLEDLELASNVILYCGDAKGAIPPKELAVQLDTKFAIDKRPDAHEGRVQGLASLYYQSGEIAKAFPLYTDVHNFFEQNRAAYPDQYARSLIELAYVTPKGKARDQLFEDGFREIESRKFPEPYNLREHYCDACVVLAREKNKEGKRDEALAYLKRGQKSANLITNDNFLRRKFFADLVEKQIHGQEI